MCISWGSRDKGAEESVAPEVVSRRSHHSSVLFFPSQLPPSAHYFICDQSQIVRMTEDTGAPTPNSAKRRCDEDAASLKRVRVDTQSPVDTTLNLGSGVHQGNKKPPK